jgi:hypothetical protein
MSYAPEPLSKTYIEKYSIPVTEAGCWLWLGSVGKLGYGLVKRKGKSFSTHRVAYELFVGKIPAGKWVLHSCDVRSCVNPNHLFLGDNQANVTDAVKKGRAFFLRAERQHGRFKSAN